MEKLLPVTRFLSKIYFREAEYVASTVEIAADKLPTKLKAPINKKYAIAKIAESVALQGTEDPAYFVK